MHSLLDDKRRRQHPLYIVFSTIKSIREVIFPIIFFFILQFGSDSNFIKYGSLAISIYIVYRFILNIFIWRNNTYVFTEQNIELTEGRFISTKRTVALNRIQSYQQQTSFFHRLFKTTSFTMVTGTDNINFYIVRQEEANRISAILKEVELKKANTGKDLEEISTESTEPPRKSVTEHYEISWKEIVFISFTSFYFLAIIPIGLTIYGNISEVFNIDAYAQTFFAYIMQSWLLITFLIIIALVISSVIGLITTYLRFGKYRVSSDDKQIYISRGVLNTANFTIPRRKINGLVIKRPFTRRIFGIVRVEFVTLGETLATETDNTDVLFPFISKKRLVKLLPEILPEYPVQAVTEMDGLPSRALGVQLIPVTIFSSIALAIVIYFWPAFWYIPVIIIAFALLYTVLFTKQAKHFHDEKFIQFQTGAFSVETYVAKRLKIDQVELRQSWLQRRFGLSSLIVFTREKPIKMAVMPHIPTSVAEYMYHWYAAGIIEQKRAS